jgi:hypothetical protein
MPENKAVVLRECPLPTEGVDFLSSVALASISSKDRGNMRADVGGGGS